MPVPTGSHEVPVFVIQGQTDPLFPSFQALDMVNRLKAVDPNWPVSVFLGDVGHSYADNPPDVWVTAHNEGNAWLRAVMRGRIAPISAVPPIAVSTTACMTGQTHVAYHASSYGTLARTVDLLHSPLTTQTTTSSNSPTSEGVQTDPIVNSGCRSMPASQSDPNQAVYTWPAPAGTLVGAAAVNVDVAVLGLSSEVAARLWEIDRSGKQTLITRTVYRIEKRRSSPPTTYASNSGRRRGSSSLATPSSWS